MAKTILLTIDEVLSKYPNFKLLSNDNAFLNTPPIVFNQRTLNARFACENETGSFMIQVKNSVKILTEIRMSYF